MIAALFQYITLLADFVVFAFFGYYLYRLHGKEVTIEKKEEKIDGDYHHIVNDALAKERKILEDATAQANHIIAQAQYTSETSKQLVHQALAKMIEDVHRETIETAKMFMTEYHSGLKQLSTQSLTGFSQASHELGTDLEKQLADFKTTFLPELEKELASYKQVRMQQADELVKKVVQKVSQEVLNKSLSLEDHQQLMLASLERAKKEGIFG